MKIFIRFFLKILLLFLFFKSGDVFSNRDPDLSPGIMLTGSFSEDMRVVILIPADSVIQGLPVLRLMPDTDTISQVVYRLFRESYMGRAVRLFYLAQNYLVSRGHIEKAEPAYLLLSQNQGGFPRFGFYLWQGDSILNKSNVPYIELVKNNAENEDYLGSMTQIYPHELGHVIYHLLAEDTDSIVPSTIDIHYSTLATDYRTAFNEGFAMQFENMARTYEPNEERKASIIVDFNQKKERIQNKIEGYDRDFKWPLRIGLYRISMLTWYQTFEDVKRFEWVSQNRIKYDNVSVLFKNPEKSLFYRNSGIYTDTCLRLPQRLFATEGVIASFFFGLLQSDAKNYFREAEFYADFFNSSDTSGKEFIKTIDPFENQYMKIFYVIHHHVNFTLTVKSQFLDFISAYILLFPEEKSIVTNLFRQATGIDYPLDPGHELWITNPWQKHGILVMEQFGGITLPFYTFNLNAATIADLLTFEEINEREAGFIVNFIRNSGPLADFDDLKKIPGLSKSVIELLAAHKFDPKDFENLDNEVMSLSINSLIFSYLKQLMTMSGLYILFSMLVAFMILYRLSQPVSIRVILVLLIRFLLLLLFALLAVVITSIPVLYFSCSALLFTTITLLIIKKEKRKRLVFTSLPMIILLIYTLI